MVLHLDQRVRSELEVLLLLQVRNSLLIRNLAQILSRVIAHVLAYYIVLVVPKGLNVSIML